MTTEPGVPTGRDMAGTTAASVTTGAASAAASAAARATSATSATSAAAGTATGTTPPRPLRIGLVSISDRASTGVYEDKGLPALTEWLGSALKSPWEQETRLIPDEAARISATLVELVDEARCDLVLTTGGTGPSRRDVTPEATLAVASKEMPGFGEQMRQISLRFVPTAILSRQVAAIREIDGHAALLVNLPGQPKSIRETLEGLRDPDGALVAAGIFAAIPYCIDLIGGPFAETHEHVVKAFRPKKK
jgi:molybdopterin adenylyltransferase